MNDRTKHLWLPGLVSLTLAMILLAPLIAISMQPRFLGRSPLEMVLLPWLAVLPLCGASGAYLSRRSGGSPRARLIAGLFPTIALLTLGSILVVTRLAHFCAPGVVVWLGRARRCHYLSQRILADRSRALPESGKASVARPQTPEHKRGYREL